MRRTLIATIAIAIILASGPLSGQSTAWGDNGYVSVNGMYEAGTTRYATTTLQDINQETTRITASHEVGPRPAFDFAAGGRLKGSFGVGFSLTYLEGTEDARVTGAIPHPFYFNQPRPLDAATPLERDDLAVHLHAMWLLPLTRRVQMTVFGGPTWFRVNQSRIASLSVDDRYPFDTVGLGVVTRGTQQASHVGFNAGFDTSYFFTRSLGVQGTVRYARGTVTLGPSDRPATLDVGGLQTGGGLRIRF